MKKRFFAIGLLVLFQHLAISQFTFETTLGTIDNDWGSSIYQCDDNGYFIVGYTENYYFEWEDIYVVKTDVAGDVVWADTLGDQQKFEWGVSGIQSFDGGYVVCAFETIPNGYDVPLLIKYNYSGNIIWNERYPNTGDVYPKAFIQTPDSGFIMCGNANHDTTSKYWERYPFVMKTSNSGEFEWFNDVNLSNGYHSFNDIELAHDSGYVVCGSYSLSGQETTCGLLLKLSPDGEHIIWKSFIVVEDRSVTFKSVKRTMDDGYIFCGTQSTSFSPIHRKADILLVKTDSSGNILWRKIIDRGGLEYAESLDVVSDNGFIITGSGQDSASSNTNVLLVRTNENGDSLWTKTFGGEITDIGRDVCSTTDGGFAISGHTNSFGFGGYDIYLIKTDEGGIVTDIRELQQEIPEVNCYPNPCSNHLTVAAKFIIQNVSLLNSTGQVLFSCEINARSGNLDLSKSNLQSGLFFLHINGKDDSIVKKIIVHR